MLNTVSHVSPAITTGDNHGNPASNIHDTCDIENETPSQCLGILIHLENPNRSNLRSRMSLLNLNHQKCICALYLIYHVNISISSVFIEPLISSFWYLSCIMGADLGHFQYTLIMLVQHVQWLKILNY